MSDDEPAPTPMVPVQRRPGDDISGILNRVRRAQGQLGGVLRMIEEGRELGDVVSQLKAVTRALDRVAFAMLTAELRKATAEGADAAELAELEKVFLSLC